MFGGVARSQVRLGVGTTLLGYFVRQYRTAALRNVSNARIGCSGTTIRLATPTDDDDCPNAAYTEQLIPQADSPGLLYVMVMMMTKMMMIIFLFFDAPLQSIASQVLHCSKQAATRGRDPNPCRLIDVGRLNKTGTG